MKDAPQTILLLGANGQLGWQLQRSLSIAGSLVSCARTPLAGSHMCALDIVDTDALVRAIRALKPAVIVNAAAYTAVDKAESDQESAFAANAIAPGIIAQEALKYGALLIHYSTDYVFDGEKSSPYLENDIPGPRTVYGASKLAGEQAIVASGVDSFIFRLSWVFSEHGSNFPKTMLRLARERESLNVVADQHGRPTPAALAADICAICIREKALRSSASSIYHLAANGECSWHGFAQETIRLAHAQHKAHLKTSVDAVYAISSRDYPTPAKRPANSVLNTDKLESLLNISLPHWQEYLARMVFLQP
ncbi:MAG: dTDP-4-dehydrorhamnose reductase [Burkholderiaceae bacterium]|nr:dTDP-4-dehydrorhamnose reductase [Burkholderiaceae bacterium]